MIDSIRILLKNSPNNHIVQLKKRNMVFFSISNENKNKNKNTTSRTTNKKQEKQEKQQEN